ncbi:MAG: DNA-binding response regulator [Chloroflexi bacterium]|nr:MAG: DNA-binding response regulator [Chloroflexota bacterium]
MSDDYTIQFNGLEVAIIENEPQSLRGLMHVLQQMGCQIVWTARNDEEALAASALHLPAVVFSDLRLMRGSDDFAPGWQLIKHLYQQGSGRRFAVIIYSSTPMTDEIVLEAIRMGCSYIVKEDLWDHERDILASAILAARSGSALLSNEVAGGLEMIVNRMQGVTLLSDKEIMILKLVADGLSNKEIAKRQFVAISTVKTHVSNILAKLQVDNRGKAAEWFRQQHG